MMKKYSVSLLLSSLMVMPAVGVAQTTNSGGDNDEKSLFEEITKIEKKTNKFNLYLNTQTNFNLEWDGPGGTNFQDGNFRFKQLRIEMKGQINDWLSYRYRQRLNKGEGPGGNFDNVLQAIDIAEVGFKVNKVNIVAGKQCASYGGIEFDLNPIEVYQYCDMIDYMTNFMTGVRAVWDVTPNQQFQFQILDDVTRSSEDMYGKITPAKMGFLYTVNWNGNFNNVYKTRWSASVMNEVKDHQMWYFAFGNEFNFTPRWGAWLDIMYSREGIDRKGLVTGVLNNYHDITQHNAFNTDYLTFLLHMNYFVAPKWNIFGKVAYERNGVYKATAPSADAPGIAKGNYGTHWLYVGGVEFYPLKDRTLHLFLTYVGQNTRHSKMAQSMYGADPSSYSNLLTCGFIWQIPLF